MQNLIGAFNSWSEWSDLKNSFASARAFVMAERRLILFGLLICLLTYQFYVSSVALDFEGYAALTARLDAMGGNYTGVGRYVLYFISRHIGSGSYTPFLSLTVFSICLSVSAILMVRLLSRETRLAEYIFIAVFVSTPFFTKAAPLWLWTLAFGLSYLTSLLAAYLVARHKMVVIPTLLMCLTLLNYQPSLGFYLIGLGVFAVTVLARTRLSEAFAELTPIAIRALVALAISIIVYLIVLALSREGGNAYTTSQTGFITSPVALAQNFWATLTESVSIILERRIFHTHFNWVLGGAAVLAVIALGRRIFIANDTPVQALISAGLCAVLLILCVVAVTPFNVVLEQATWFNRTLTPYAGILAFIFYLACRSHIPTLRTIGAGLSIIAIWWFVQFSNVSSFSQYVANKYDEAVINRMIDYIVAQPGYDPDTRYQILAVNPSWRHSSPASGAMDYGAIIYAHTTGDFRYPSGIMMAINGLANVTPAPNPAALRVQYADEIEELGRWPRPDSVTILDDRLIVVKFP